MHSATTLTPGTLTPGTLTPGTLTPGTLTPTPSLSDLAGAAKVTRNRAVDAYRAAAMVAVAIGHWLVIAVSTGADGRLVARNALEVAPQLGWLTWLFQVMPLFFVVGGFSSAMSLDAHWAKGGRDHDWVVSRLRRMVAPTVVLAGTWLALLGGAAILGGAGLLAAGATAAAIPLWFLANYTIDTAFAPLVLRTLRRSRRLLLTSLGATFLAVEAMHLAGIPHVEHLNWVLGWMLFQIGGFLWRDGVLATGRRLGVIAAALWAAAVAMVAIGPWPVSMIHIPDTPFSPTHPPSIALVVFGAAYSATALAFAPMVSRFLERSRRTWTVVVAANTMSMSVYLWHFTAAVFASAAFYAAGWLPSAEIGSGMWWIEKIPLVLTAAAVLVPIVAVVARYERRALLAPAAPWAGHPVQVFAIAAVISMSLKLWTAGGTTAAVIGMAGLVVSSRVTNAWLSRG